MSVVIPSISARLVKICMDAHQMHWRDSKIHVLIATLHDRCGTFEGSRVSKTAS